MVKYTLKRSARKTLSIYIRHDGEVEVRAPYYVSKEEIDAYIKEKAIWIEQKQTIIKERNQKKKSIVLKNGGNLRLLGKEYPIVCKNTTKIRFDGQCFFFPDFSTPEDMKQNAMRLYKAIAKDILSEKVQTYAAIMNAKPTAVKINSAKTRWGSCSGKNSLNFSWKLIMAPESAVDYVVIHELVHTFEHNHSPAFWELVSSYVPDYKKEKEILKEVTIDLCLENWD